jgi:hypothetical protein
MENLNDNKIMKKRKEVGATNENNHRKVAKSNSKPAIAIR